MNFQNLTCVRFLSRQYLSIITPEIKEVIFRHGYEDAILEFEAIGAIAWMIVGISRGGILVLIKGIC